MRGYLYTLKRIGKPNFVFNMNDFFKSKYKDDFLYTLKRKKELFDSFVLIYPNKTIKDWKKITIQDMIIFLNEINYNINKNDFFTQFLKEKKIITEYIPSKDKCNLMDWNFNYSYEFFNYQNNNTIQLGIKNNLLIDIYENWDSIEFEEDRTDKNIKVKVSYEFEKLYENFENFVEFGIILKIFEYSPSMFLADSNEEKIHSFKIIFGHNNKLEFSNLHKDIITIFYQNNLYEINKNESKFLSENHLNIKDYLNYIFHNFTLNMEDKKILKKIIKINEFKERL